MNLTDGPRHFISHAGLPGAGLPNDRMARLAARRVFVELKHNFMQAVSGLSDARGEWLREQVRRAEEPEDLLLLRGHVFASLAGARAQPAPPAQRAAPQPRLAVPRQRAAQQLPVVLTAPRPRAIP